MDKEDTIAIDDWILLIHRKEQNNAICRNMDATRDYHTKWSQSERERQVSYDITYMWNLKYGTNKPIYKTERLTGSEKRHVVAKGEEGGEEGGVGVWG